MMVSLSKTSYGGRFALAVTHSWRMCVIADVGWLGVAIPASLVDLELMHNHRMAVTIDDLP